MQRFQMGQERKTMNVRASASERKILPVMCHNMGIALMLKPQLSLILPTKLFLLLRRRLQHAPPPAPHDIFLRHKECRVYQRSGKSKIRITKTPEAVYYHPLRSCAPLATRDNIEIEEATEGRLVESNKQLLWREFGMKF